MRMPRTTALLCLVLLWACDDEARPGTELPSDQNELLELSDQGELELGHDEELEVEQDLDAEDMDSSDQEELEELDDELEADEADLTELEDSDLVDAEDELEDLDALPDAVDAEDEGEDQSSSDPYEAIEDLRNAELRAALEQLSSATHEPLDYEIARNHMFGADQGIGFEVHDGLIECVYTGRTVAPDGSQHPDGVCTLLDGSLQSCGFNTEHTWPQSQLIPPEDPTGRADLHHLFPTWDVANNRRSNYAFGEPDCTPDTCDWAEGGSKLGSNDLGSRVFEVRPEYRGNIARAMFYMAVRYDMSISQPSEGILRRWHDEDPVDNAERARQDQVEALQHNRNPFIDRPDFANYILDY
ncbi:MAG: endonuclease [Myxococcota bacterium]|nr:endonuclease [Myxococcota bacterium]